MMYYKYASVVILPHIVAKNYDCVLIFMFNLSLGLPGKIKATYCKQWLLEVTQPPCTNIWREAKILQHTRKALYASNLESETKKNKEVGRLIRACGLVNIDKDLDRVNKQHTINIVWDILEIIKDTFKLWFKVLPMANTALYMCPWWCQQLSIVIH
jgi:hypothetical protein